MQHCQRFRYLLGGPVGSLTAAYLSSSTRNGSKAICHQQAQIGTATYPANNPSEDRYVYHIDTESACKMIAVVDGHGGWQVSEYVSKSLVETLKKHTIFNIPFKKESLIDKGMKTVFQDLENGYLDQVRSAYKLGFGSVASVGCCLLVALQQDKNVVIANCGDCRAVLGNQSADGGKYIGITITKDHNCREIIEQIKLLREHPGEENAFVCKPNNTSACYVKGRLQLTRSIGDAYLKYHAFNALEGAHRSAGRHIPSPYTPPYVSHEPEMHHIELGTNDKFLIIASDGVWDFMSAQEAVEIVASVSEMDGNKAAALLVQKTIERAAAESG